MSPIVELFSYDCTEIFVEWMQLMENVPSSSSSKPDRRMVERNRRNHMKALYSRLNSLLPDQNAREIMSQPNQLHEATNYIKKLKDDLEKMKGKKRNLLGINGGDQNSSVHGRMRFALKHPEFEVLQTGSALHTTLITGLDCHSLFNGLIKLLHEEGVEVVSASFSIVGETAFHSIHCEVDVASASKAPRISERLRRLIQEGQDD